MQPCSQPPGQNTGSEDPFVWQINVVHCLSEFRKTIDTKNKTHLLSFMYLDFMESKYMMEYKFLYVEKCH